MHSPFKNYSKIFITERINELPEDIRPHVRIGGKVKISIFHSSSIKEHKAYNILDIGYNKTAVINSNDINSKLVFLIRNEYGENQWFWIGFVEILKTIPVQLNLFP